MGFFFAWVSEDLKGLIQTFLEHTEIVTHLKMRLEVLIFMVETKFLLVATNVTREVVDLHMFGK